MTISSLSALRSAIQQAVSLSAADAPPTVTAGRLASNWNGAAPATTEALTRDSTGALTPPRAATRLLAVDIARETGALMLADRLVHSAGLSGTSTSRQTTGLPTAALPRHTSGDGVFAYLTAWSAIGSTATTATVEYTNEDGDAKTTTVVIGGSGEREAGALLPIPLAAGDRGVRSVEAVTLAATTGTAGNFGIVLAKPVAIIPAARAEPLNGLGPLLNPFDVNAALELWSFISGAASTNRFAGELLLGED